MHYWDIKRVIRRIIIWIFIVLCLIPISIFGHLSIQSNSELVSTAIQEIAVEMIDTLHIAAGSHISLNSFGEFEKQNQLIRNNFLILFKKHDIELYLSPDSMEDGLELQIMVQNLSVRYGNPFRKRFLGTRWISRHIQIKLMILAIRKKTQKIVYIEEKMKEKKDEVPYNLLKTIQKEGEMIQCFEYIEKGGIQKWLEPILAIGAAIGIGCLFYFIRS